MCEFKETKKIAAVLHSPAKVKEEHRVRRGLPARRALKDHPDLPDQLVAGS
ncbi:MAG TPA: hypothetical protein VF182_06375 [Candidatus Binatia bacterium]